MKPHARLALVALVALWLSPALALAKDFYVDPAAGSDDGDGSEASPWKTLEAVVKASKIETQGWESLPYAEGKKLVPKNAGAPVKAGDTIWLRDGYHGRPLLQGYYNAQTLTVAAAPGHNPRLAELRVQAGSNFKFVGLQISPDYAPAYDKHTLVAIESHNFHGPALDITVEGCSLTGKLDTSAWTKEDWDALSPNGISASGKNITLRKNTLKNVNFAISVTASDSLVEWNDVDFFSGDGMRGLGDNNVFQYNTIKNLVYVNDNHPDGFQSWSTGADGKVGTGEVKGVVLRGNTFINYTDPGRPFQGNLQGIGCFDGMYVDWVVENNVILTDHWHGISLYGAKNARVVNNTVVNIADVKVGPPWIMINDHKNGTKPEGCVVRNNIATDLNLAASGVVEDHNLITKNFDPLFVNKPAFDLHLKPGSEAVDKGSPDLAPPLDIELFFRPQGAGFDLGAHEWHDGSAGQAGSSGSSGQAGASGEAGSGGSAAGGSAAAGAGQAGSGQAGAGGGAAGAAGAGAAGAGAGGGAGGSGQAGGAGQGGSAQAGKGGSAAGAPAQGGAGGSSSAGAAGAAAGGVGGAGKGGSAAAGAAGGAGGASGASAAATAPASEDDGGCGCRTAPRPGATGGALWLAALAAVGAGRRARRQGRG